MFFPNLKKLKSTNVNNVLFELTRTVEHYYPLNFIFQVLRPPLQYIKLFTEVMGKKGKDKRKDTEVPSQGNQNYVQSYRNRPYNNLR